MNAKITFEIVDDDDKLVCPYQGEVENIALDKLGTHHNIFFEPTPLTDKFDVIWDQDSGGWVLRYLLDT